MGTLLLRHARVLATMDGERREIADGGLFARDGVIEAVGPTATLPAAADEILDVSGCVVIPGLVNTHHHLFQTLTRAVPAGQDALLFGWLQSLYPIWSRMGPEEIHSSALIGLAEMALAGCTLSSDHLYIFPNGARLEDEIDAALRLGVRLHAMRGSMSVGESVGGLPPDALCENEPAILEDCIRVIDAHHDARPGALIRVGVAPCSPFSVSPGLMRDSALLARDKGVLMHTHLAENDEDIAYSLATFGQRPGDFAEGLGWVGEDVWHAHCVKLDASEIALFARTGTGVAHCPCSNCRLGSGIAPVRAMRDAGVKVGLGVDGSASNDSGDLLAEARQAMLLQRVSRGADAMSAREALEIATLGGAQVLGRDDLGSLSVGKRADFAVFATDGLAQAGGWDPLAGLLLCADARARETYVEGRAVVREGRIVMQGFEAEVEKHRRLARRLAEG
ncbi:8-oxoguanine deaminase [Albimonas pacifica]|uniref:Cytosine/adenosine deaminase n=1 Tax=Albimonas pacifica TaxID=1114924 RepID=A0A1I3KSR7_9RHOB|nr:8-oxoguanine deaminase [Albimonas pacifica]SFI75559.1 Cytosine/adenosine deaminase [Albimonas pacifica]